MTNHLVIHLSDDQAICALINDNHEILATNRFSGQDLKSCLKSLTKEQKNNIGRIIVIPETTNITTIFIRITIGATDNFNETLINKLHNNYIATKDTIIKYKIVSESQGDKIEYLLAVLIMPIKFYKTINKNISRIKQTKSIQWIPANYCLTLSIIDCKEFSDTPLIIHVTDTQTNIIIKDANNTIAISTLPFSINRLKLCLQEDGLSDNQINNKISLRLSFDKELGFNTRLLVNDTLSDLQKEIQFICSTNKINITSGALITEKLTHSDLAKIISEKLIIPCQYVPIPEINITTNTHKFIIEKRLLSLIYKALQIVKDMQIFITYIPKKTYSEETYKKVKKMPKNIIVFFTLLIAIICIVTYFNIHLNNSIYMDKTSLYGIKDQVTSTKTQYIEISESLYKLKKLKGIEERIMNLGKENNITKTTLENILQNIPNDISLNDMSIQLRDNRILISGKAQKNKTIYNYLNILSTLNTTQKILLKRISPENPIHFAIEVQL
ncbi:MAG: hypothetical protein WCH76_01415 [Candidatus Riflemargulisbacteria bacterium]